MKTLHKLCKALLGLWLGLAGGAQATPATGFAVPGFELVYTAPRGTTLINPDLRSATAVWSELFDGARREICIGQFYVVGKSGEELDQVIARLEAAGKRGVAIRFLIEKKGPSDEATLARLRAIPNLTMRTLEFGQLGGAGIIHAKYLLVDGKAAFVGSQNFDWRALAHIHETGLKITQPAIVAQLQAIFEYDWNAQQVLAAGGKVPAVQAALTMPGEAAGSYLVAAPRAYTPAGIVDAETELVRLLAQAKHEVLVQVLDYMPLDYGPDGTRPYYAVIDNAVRAALTRGVKIKLLVSHWNTEPPGLAHLQSLALLPNIEIKVVTVPQEPGNFIPYARVTHSKFMVIDGALAWIGTSNWSGGYFNNSRSLEVVLRDRAMAHRVAALHAQLWHSQYAQPLRTDFAYPKPAKAAPGH
ncbi:MAG TPA: phospholipase D-like domain-containing protein [Burkholderiaceae bacterium]